MLYVCKLTHPITGSSNTHFDTKDNCETYARLNNDDFVSEVRPARSDEIRREILELRRRRKSVQFNYEYSPWSMGPGYRASLARLDSQLLRLTSALDDLGPDSGVSGNIRIFDSSDTADVFPSPSADTDNDDNDDNDDTSDDDTDASYISGSSSDKTAA